MKNKGSKPKAKKKGSENAFGCDLTEHLRTSGQDVPQVLKQCADFVEKHGIVDGIYRLSGVTSNIQRLRQEFCSEATPDLTKEVYLQDIHCVGSLCKLYFRELPNPLLTYELYHKFTKAVSVQGDQEKLLQIQSVIKELPVPHFRTLEYLTKHLAHLATFSPQTNMHTRNLALVWAPNLLRSKDIEASSCNGDMAFQEVRIQQSVVEFILNHSEQIFNHGAVQIKPKEGLGLMCGEKYATLPISSQCGPMKLMSLEEAQARSLGPNHPAHRERQRENSLPDTSAAGFYHTAIDLTDSKRKFSEKSKKWKSIFSLGKDSKGRLSRNGSVFIRGPNISEKMSVRPARSMDSLCSLTTDDDRGGQGFSPACSTNNGVIVPDVKSRTLESEILYDLSEQEPALDLKGNITAAGAAGGSSPSRTQRGSTARSPGASAPQQKALPEQLKVFKSDNLSGYQPTSPKNRRMLYSGSSHSSSSRPSFPGNLFPLELSPRHQRKALNISEPFAVSVPLRVSAVISSNSTPCRKEPPVATTRNKTLNCSRENSLSEQSTHSGSSGYSENSSKSLSLPLLDTTRPRESVESREETLTKSTSEDSNKEVAREGEGRLDISELEQSPTVSVREDKETSPPTGKQWNNQLVEHHQPKVTQRDKGSSAIEKELWSDLNHELKITEPEIDILEEEFKPAFCSKSTEDAKLKPNQRNSPPTQALLYGGQAFMPSNTPTTDLFMATGLKPQPSESDILFDLMLTADTQPSESDILCDFMLTDFTADTKNPLPHSLDFSNDTENKTYEVSPKNEASCINKPVDTIDKPVDNKPVDTIDKPVDNKPVDTIDKPVDNKPVDTIDKPVDNKPVDTIDKPVDNKPVDTIDKPVDNKPVDTIDKPVDNKPVDTIDKPVDNKPVDSKPVDTNLQSVPQRSQVEKPLQTGDSVTTDTSLSVDDKNQEALGKREVPQEDKNVSCDGGGKENTSAPPPGGGGGVERLSVCLEVRPHTLVLPNLDDEDGCGGGNSEELDLVEPWEDLSFSTKQWVTSPLHSPSIQDLFASLLPSCATGETPNSQQNTSSSQTNKQSNEACSVSNAEPCTGSGSQTYGSEPETKGSYLQTVPARTALVGDNAAQPHVGNCGTAKLKNTQSSSQRLHRQASQDTSRSERNEENCFAKHRPYSLNLDLGHRCIRDISNQQNHHNSSEFSFSQRGSVTPSGTATTHTGLPLELELFLKDRQAPARRNSAPVSVSSVRTAFMIKTCQAKAVPVIPPKVQYSHIPHSRHDNKGLDGTKGQEKEHTKTNRERTDSAPPPFQTITDLKEELENKEPAPKYQRQPIITEKSAESLKTTPAPELPVIRRRHPSNAEMFADCPRPDRSNLLQRPSFRNRQRPQSLILLSPPFPIMDYPPLGDDGKFPLSPIKSLTDTSAMNVFSKEMAENLRNPEGITLPNNKMTIPKSGQRLETSTSCFYQPQRRSMIFDSRSHRQIE